MGINSDWLNNLLLCICILLSVGIILCLIRAIRGPRFTDRIVAVNVIGTIVIVMMCLLSSYFNAGYLLDIAIVYALLSFIVIVVLTRLVLVRRRAQEERENAEAGKGDKL